MDFSESLSMLTDSLLNQPMIDFNAEILFSNLLCEGEEEEILEDNTSSLICEETSLLCEEELSLEDAMNKNSKQEADSLEVMSDQTEVMSEQTTELKQVLSKRSKTKSISKRGQFKKGESLKRASNLRASNKSHQEVVTMISLVYESLPKTYIFHHSFVKITKIQKLDQIHKFVLSTQRNGYTADK